MCCCRCYTQCVIHSAPLFVSDLGWSTSRILSDQHVCQRFRCGREWDSHLLDGRRSATNTVIGHIEPCSALFVIEVLSITVLFFFLSVGLEEEGRRHFEIDSESGDIRTTELFTENTEPFYTLRIKAKDSGASPLEDTAVIHIQVQSVLHFIL